MQKKKKKSPIHFNELSAGFTMNLQNGNTVVCLNMFVMFLYYVTSLKPFIDACQNDEFCLNMLDCPYNHTLLACCFFCVSMLRNRSIIPSLVLLIQSNEDKGTST